MCHLLWMSPAISRSPHYCSIYIYVPSIIWGIWICLLIVVVNCSSPIIFIVMVHDVCNGASYRLSYSCIVNWVWGKSSFCSLSYSSFVMKPYSGGWRHQETGSHSVITWALPGLHLGCPHTTSSVVVLVCITSVLLLWYYLLCGITCSGHYLRQGITWAAFGLPPYYSPLVRLLY